MLNQYYYKNTNSISVITKDRREIANELSGTADNYESCCCKQSREPKWGSQIKIILLLQNKCLFLKLILFTWKVAKKASIACSIQIFRILSSQTMMFEEVFLSLWRLTLTPFDTNLSVISGNWEVIWKKIFSHMPDLLRATDWLEVCKLCSIVFCWWLECWADRSHHMTDYQGLFNVF